ncbi:MAG: endonuclease/exonuclease/phosphatase family protein [Pseudomonadota bacterium]
MSWNIRAGGGKRIGCILDNLIRWQPDVICLNEFRGTPPSLDLACALVSCGFPFQRNTVNASDKAKNALLIASAIPIKRTWRKGMPDNAERWLSIRLNRVLPIFLGIMHIPNYTHPHLKYPFMQAVLELQKRWRSSPAIFLGDTNCGKRGIDEEQYSSVLFRREHDWMENIESNRWVDIYRHFHGSRREFTWYSHRNNGFRLDHAFCNQKMLPAVCSIRYEWGHDPTQAKRRDAVSDHAAMIIDLDS